MVYVKNARLLVGFALALSLLGNISGAETPRIEIRGGQGETRSSNEASAPQATSTSASPASAASSTPAKATAETSNSAYGSRGYGPLTKSDTLWSIANKVRPSTKVSVYQTIIALYDNNTGSFENGNINRLRPGAYLKLPSESDAAAINNAAAVERFNALSRGKDTRKVIAVAAKEAKAPVTQTTATQLAAPAEPVVSAKAQPKVDKPATAKTAAKTAEVTKELDKEQSVASISLKREAINQQLQELQTALQTEREEIARLRSSLSGKDNELALLRQQIGRDEALQQQVADLMRAKVELDELRGMHQGQLSGQPWYQPLLQSSALLALFLAIPMVLLLLLLWALFIRRAGEEQGAYVSPFNEDASLREEVASFDSDTLEIPRPGVELDLTAEVNSALSLDELDEIDDLLVPSKPIAPATAAPEDKAPEPTEAPGRIDLSDQGDALPDLDALLGESSAPAAAKSAPESTEAATDDPLDLDDIDNLLANFGSDNKQGKAEPEPAAPVQVAAPRNKDELLSDDDLAAALAGLNNDDDDIVAETEAAAVEDAAEADDIDALLAANATPVTPQTDAELAADSSDELDVDALLAANAAPVAAAVEEAAEADDIDALLAANATPVTPQADAELAADSSDELDVDALLAANTAPVAAAVEEAAEADDIDALLAANTAPVAAAVEDAAEADDIDALLAANATPVATAVEDAAPSTDEIASADLDLAAADTDAAEDTIELELGEDSDPAFAELLAAADAELEQDRQPQAAEPLATRDQPDLGAEASAPEAELPDLGAEDDLLAPEWGAETEDTQGADLAEGNQPLAAADEHEDLNLDLGDLEGLTAGQILQKLDAAEASAAVAASAPAAEAVDATAADATESAAEFDLADLAEFTEEDAAASLADEPATVTIPSAAPATDAEESFELLDLESLGDFTEDDAAQLDGEADEFKFDGVTDFSEESLLAAAAQEQAAAQQQDAIEPSADTQDLTLEDQLTAAIDALSLDNAVDVDNDLDADDESALVVQPADEQPQDEAALEQAAEATALTAEAQERVAADDAAHQDAMLAELAALGDEGDTAPAEAEVEVKHSSSEPIAPPTATTPELALVADDEEEPAAEQAEEQAEEPELADAEDEQLLPVAPIPVEAFAPDIENTLAALDSVSKQPAPLFQADHSEHDRLSEALPAGFQGQSKVKSTFLGFEEILPEVNHVDVDDDNGCNAKLDLARAYIDIDDPEGAREILDEVMNEGNTDQRIEVQRLLLLMQRRN